MKTRLITVLTAASLVSAACGSVQTTHRGYELSGQETPEARAFCSVLAQTAIPTWISDPVTGEKLFYTCEQMAEQWGVMVCYTAFVGMPRSYIVQEIHTDTGHDTTAIEDAYDAAAEHLC